MATVTEDRVQAFAFCLDGGCKGYEQTPVDAIKTTTAVTCAELGGDLPMTERTFEQVRFADEADATCDVCGKARGISEQERPEYPNISGQDPMTLLHRKAQGERLSKLEKDSGAELAELRASVAAMQAQNAALLQALAGNVAPKPAARKGKADPESEAA